MLAAELAQASLAQTVGAEKSEEEAREDAPAELAAQLTRWPAITNRNSTTRGAGGGWSHHAWVESATG